MINTKIISFIGLEYEDVPYYISQAIAEKNNNVLVIDNSASHSLFLSLKTADEDADSVETGRVVFLRNRGYSKNNYDKFDCVIIFHGLNVEPELVLGSDMTVFVTDYLPSHMREIKKFIDMDLLYELDPDKFSILYRDQASGKVAEQWVKSFYGLPKTENESIISMNETDMALRLNFQHNGAQSIRWVSNEMKAYIKKYQAMFRDRKYLESGKEEPEEKDVRKKKKKGGLLPW